MKTIMKTIKLYQARELINQRYVDGLFYVDKVSDEDCPEIIFKSNFGDQLYSFYYLGITIDTIQKFNTLLYGSDYDDFDVKVAPVKRITKQIMVTKYIGEEINNEEINYEK